MVTRHEISLRGYYVVHVFFVSEGGFIPIDDHANNKARTCIVSAVQTVFVDWSGTNTGSFVRLETIQQKPTPEAVNYQLAVQPTANPDIAQVNMLRNAVLTLLASGLIRSSFAFYPYPMLNSSYVLNASFSGPSFFDNFDFYTGPDPTKAHVKYLDITTANRSGLVGFNMAANESILQAPAYIGTDYQTKTPEGRPSVRIMSKQVFNHSLIIADILHMPAPVCGVWPAYWMLGTSRDWPDAGEIDILENINDANYNKYTLHTNAGVLVNNDTSSMKGIMTTPNCDIKAPGQGANEGCSVSDSPATGSYGNLFNQDQGGVFATETDSKGISIWFFNRTHIPADIIQGHPVPPSTNNRTSIWGLPNARFAGNNTDFDGHFRDLQIVFNTAFCGEWISSMWSKNPTCSKLAPTCEDYVTNNPQDFGAVYWSINSVKVYTRNK